MLSASGAHRWMECTPSAKLEQRAGQDSKSSYAREGELAHELLEYYLLARYFPEQIGEQQLAELETSVIKEFGDLAWYEMVNYISEVAAQVMEIYAKVEADGEHPVMFLETRLDFSHIVPDGFGTGDILIITNKRLYVIDLKYGRGIQVFAKTNPQLLLYSTGALKYFEMLYDPRHVHHVIIQPRLQHYDEWKCTSQYVRNWGVKVAAPKAKKAFDGEGKKRAGEHCKFCKVSALCRTHADWNLKIAEHDFADPDLLSTKEAAKVYAQIKPLQDWAESVKEHLLEEAGRGISIPGYKLVEGRTKRKWGDEEAVAEALSQQSVDPYVQKLKTITQLTAELGATEFNKLASQHIIKPTGKPTLVPLSDKRTAIGIETAKEEFDILDDGKE